MSEEVKPPEDNKMGKGFFLGVGVTMLIIIYLTWPLTYFLICVALNYLFYGRSGLN